MTCRSDDNSHLQHKIQSDLISPHLTKYHFPTTKLTLPPATVRIAADGGANRVYAIREHLASTAGTSFPKLDFIVGDLDSLEDTTRTWFLSQWEQQHHHPPPNHGRAGIGADAEGTTTTTTTSGQIIRIDDQYSADFAKAVKHARELARFRKREREQERRRLRSHRASQPREEENSKKESNGNDDREGGEEGKKEEEEEDIICYSGLGGRVDQAMSQLHHLYMFQQRPPRRSRRRPGSPDEGIGGGGGDGGGSKKEDDGEKEGQYAEEGGYANGRMYLTNGESLTFVLLAGQHRIRIRDTGSRDDNNNNNNSSIDNEDEDDKKEKKKKKKKKKKKNPHTFGKHVGIIPLTGPSELTTRGLEWDVKGWRTAFGEQLSTSNHTTPDADVVVVETSRDVLFTIDVPVLES